MKILSIFLAVCLLTGSFTKAEAAKRKRRAENGSTVERSPKKKYWDEVLLDGVWSGNLDQVKAALQNQANPNVRFEGTPCLVQAIRNYKEDQENSVRIIKALLDTNIDPNQVDTQTNTSPLAELLARCTHQTCNQSAMWVVEPLLEKGADPNFVYEGAPLLSHACNNYGPEMLTVLLEAGANPNDAPSFESRPIVAAINHAYARPKAISILLAKGADATIIDPSTGKGLLHGIYKLNGLDFDFSELIRAGARADIQDSDGNTFLHVVLKSNLSGRGELLLRNVVHALEGLDFDVTLKNVKGQTPMDLLVNRILLFARANSFELQFIRSLCNDGSFFNSSRSRS